MVIFKDTCTKPGWAQLIDILVRSGYYTPSALQRLDKYPLVTQKLADYILFKEIASLMKNK